jgi:hypothetical protein
MKFTIGKFTDGNDIWISLILKSISQCQQAVKDIIGRKLAESELNSHSLYDKGERFLSFDTAKVVFKDLCENMYKNNHIIMNNKGGYISLKSVEWELLEEKDIEIDYNDDLNEVLKKETIKLT